MAEAKGRPAGGSAVPSRHILVLCFSDLANDPRVGRQIALLAGRYRLTAAGFTRPLADGAEYVHLPYLSRPGAHRLLALAMLALGRFERLYWSSPTIRNAFEALKDRHFDLVLANDLLALPLACALKPRRGVVFDAHEYSPRQLEDRFYDRLLYQRYHRHLCRRYLPAAAGMLTVCQSVADEYRKNFGVSPQVFFNTPPYHDLTPGAAVEGVIRMVHHGAAIPSRRIELMIETMKHLDDRFRLDFLLVPGDAAYIRRLAALAGADSRIRIVAPVPMPELPRHLNRYDVGLFLLPPVNFNYQSALPNKFFEFVQARLAIAVGPSPEMARLVRRYDCGIVADDFSPRSLAARLNALDRDRIDYFKRHSHEAAKALCLEKSAPVLSGMVENLLGAA